MKTLFIKLRPALIRKIRSVLSTRLRIQKEFLKLAQTFTPESTLRLSFREKEQKMKTVSCDGCANYVRVLFLLCVCVCQVIAGLRLKTYSTLSCIVSELRLETITILC